MSLLSAVSPEGPWAMVISLTTQLTPNRQAYGPFNTLKGRYFKLVITSNHGAQSKTFPNPDSLFLGSVFYVMNYIQFIGFDGILKSN